MTSPRTKKASAASKPKTGAKPKSKRWWEAIVVLAVMAALSIRLFSLISRYAVNIFFSDQWDFNDATLFQKHSLWEMFRWEHGPVRQGMGALVAFLIEPHFHWNSRSESFLVGIIVIVVTLLALVLKWRLFGAVTLFDVCIPLIFLNPLQHETLFMTANLAHGPLPVLLVLLYCLAWTIPNLPWRYGLVLLINFATIYTGFGFFLGVITPVALVADYWLELRHARAGKIYFALALVLSLVSLGSFFLQYVFQSAVDCSPNLFTSPGAYLQFLFLIFANLLGVQGIDLFPQLAGAVIGLALVAAFAVAFRDLWISGKTPRSSAWVAGILLSYALLFAANTAYGRSCLELHAAQESRYIMYMELALLGFYFVLLAMRKSALRLVLLLVLTAALVATVPVRPRDALVMSYYSLGKQNWKACYLQLEDIRQCNAIIRFVVYPRPEQNNLKGKLEFLKQTRQNLYSDSP